MLGIKKILYKNLKSYSNVITKSSGNSFNKRFFSITQKTFYPEGFQFWIEPLPRENESLKTKKARLVYQSRKRGILETDLLLSTFAAKYLDELSEKELCEYDKLLDEGDWDILYWVTGVKGKDSNPLPEQWKDAKIIQKIREHARARRDTVMRMPDL